MKISRVISEKYSFLHVIILGLLLSREHSIKTEQSPIADQ